MLEIFSPINGKSTSLRNVNDDVFSQRILGDGIAVIPQSDEFYSPLDGEVVMIFETQHAIGIKSECGIEILIHIGVDTLNLRGTPFNTKVKVGDKVSKGDLLTIVDWKYIRSKGLEVIAMIIVVNMKFMVEDVEKDVSVGDLLLKIA